MKAFCLKSPGVVGYCDVPEPTLDGYPYGAIIHPIAVAPCSSDVHTAFGGGSPKAPNLVFGHESIGIVAEVAPYVKDFHAGDKVAIPAITPDWREKEIQNGNYGHAGAHFSGHQLGRTMPGVFADKFLVRDADTTLVRIPDYISDKQALMSVDVVTTGFTGAEMANIKMGDTVCVIGIGPIGLMAIAGAKLLGAARIIAIGTRPKCIELAKFYGATDIVSYKEGDIAEQVLAMTNQKGVDSVIIAGGGDEVFTQAFDMVCYGTGTVSNVNYFGGTGTLGYPKFSGGRGMAGKTLHTSLAKGGRARIERIFEMIRYGRVDPTPLVTHELNGFENVEKGLILMKEKPQNLVKVMINI
jgi:threonine dehydrogenase-like Zn-dependent dehydrogenase